MVGSSLVQYVHAVPDHKVAMVRFNRPEKLNAFNDALALEFAHAMHRFAEDTALVAVLTGSGRAFTAGRDISEHIDAGRPRLEAPRIDTYNPFWPGKPSGAGHSRTLQKPVVAAVNGYAFGLGFFLAMAADICIAAEDAQFEISEVHHGIPAGWEAAARLGLPRSIGMELAFGQRVPAVRAYQLGLINEVTSSSDMLPTALDWANRIASLDPRLVAAQRTFVDSLWPAIPQDLTARAQNVREAISTGPTRDTAVMSVAGRGERCGIRRDRR